MPDVPGPPVAVTNTPLPGPLAVWRLMANVTGVVLPVFEKWSRGMFKVTHSNPSAMSLAHGPSLAGNARGPNPSGTPGEADVAAAGATPTTASRRTASQGVDEGRTGAWY